MAYSSWDVVAAPNLTLACEKGTKAAVYKVNSEN